MRVLFCDVCQRNRKELPDDCSSLDGWKVEDHFVTCLGCRLEELEKKGGNK